MKKVIIYTIVLLVLVGICGGGKDNDTTSPVATSINQPSMSQPSISQPPTNQPSTRPPAPTTPAGITVKAGELSNYKDKITKAGIVNVYKLNGEIDDRKDDLKELCLDWYFYRNQILKHTANGNTEKADKARVGFDKTNRWLEDYNEDDVMVMLSIVSDWN